MVNLEHARETAALRNRVRQLEIGLRKVVAHLLPPRTEWEEHLLADLKKALENNDERGMAGVGNPADGGSPK